MAEKEDSVLPGGTRLAHYEIVRMVGEGGMGTVYEAYDGALDRTVAVKVLRTEVADREGIVARFQREARAAARVNHENLTHVYHVGEAATRHFIAMEFLPGENLFDHVEHSGPLELEAAIDALVQAARGLDAAHRGGVIHRDVKPSNLQLLPEGRVKVTDFGLAKSLSAEVDVTGVGQILGTPRFMSPEQCRGEKMDWRSDLYSLGLVAWYVLAGRNAYVTESVGKLLDEQMNRPLPSILEVRPGLPVRLQGVLERLCAKDPDERPESMEEAIRLLESLRPGYLNLAPAGTRLAAVGVDVAAAILSLLAVIGLVIWTRPDIRLEETSPWWAESAFGLAVFIVLTSWEAWLGSSPGKLFFSLRVVRLDGSRPGYSRAVSRFLLSYSAFVVPGLLDITMLEVTFLAFQILTMVAAFFCFIRFTRRTHADLLTRTRVVYRTTAASREKESAE